MTDDLHNIDRLFKNAIDNGEEMPSPDVWDKIDQSLDKENVISINRKYTNLKRASLALLLFAFVMGIYALQIKYKNQEIITAIKKKEPIHHSTSTLPSSQSNNSNKEENKDNIVTNKHDSVKQISIEKESSKTNEPVVTKDAVEQSSSSGAVEKPVINNVTNTTVSQPETAETTATITNTTNETKTTTVKTGNKKKKVLTGRTDDTQNVSDNTVAAGKKTTSANNEKPTAFLQKLQPAAIDKNKLLQLPVFNLMNLTSNFNSKLAKPKRQSALPSFSLNIFFSPEISSNRLVDKPSTAPPPRGRDREEFKNKEQYASSKTTGILVDYNLGGNWSIESGLALSSSTIKIDTKTIYAQPDNAGNISYRYNCSSGYSYISPKQGNTPAVGDSITALASKNTLQYVIIPLGVKYTVSKGKFSISPALGVAANIKTKGKIETEFGNAPVNEKTATNNVDGLKSAYVSGLISVGAEYKLSKTFSIGLTPTTRLALSSINKDGLVKSYPKALGLAAGLRVSF